MNNTELQTPEKRPTKTALTAFEIFEALIRAVVLVFIILTFFFKICTVVGDSMNNSFSEGRRLLVQSFAYTPDEGDVVVFHQTGTLSEPVIKRVIATGNKWVLIDYDQRTLYVSEDEVFDRDDIVDESAYRYLDSGKYNRSGTYKVFVPEGYLFVMGDNRNCSLDSRSPSIGLVDARRVLGKVILNLS